MDERRATTTGDDDKGQDDDRATTTGDDGKDRDERQRQWGSGFGQVAWTPQDRR
jgi:hypothetical protein